MQDILKNKIFLTVLLILILVGILVILSKFNQVGLLIPEGEHSFRIPYGYFIIFFVAVFMLYIAAIIPGKSRGSNTDQAIPSAASSAAGNKPDKKIVTDIEEHTKREVKAENLIPLAIPDDIHLYAEAVLSHIAHEYQIVQGLFYFRNPGTDIFKPVGKYAWYTVDEPADIRLGESLAGQAVKDGKTLTISNIPEDYIHILSGLGSSSPKHLFILPLMHKSIPVGFIELASFIPVYDEMEAVLGILASRIATQIAEQFSTQQI